MWVRGSARDRVLGALTGGAIGDAWGSTVEGQRASTPALRPWQLTDDTQLTVATCEAILATGSVRPEQIASRFLAWFQAGRLTGLGSSTLKALNDLSVGGHWALSGARGAQAAGNGAAMRIAPLAFALPRDDASTREVIRDVCRITHHHDEAYIGALAIFQAIQDAYAARATDLALLAKRLPDSRVRDSLGTMSSATRSSIQEIAARYGASGFVAESVPLALVAAERGRELGFEQVLDQVIQAGGDTDTTASLTGQIMGARIGLSNLPPDLVRRIPQMRGLEVFKPFAEWVATRRLLSDFD